MNGQPHSPRRTDTATSHIGARSPAARPRHPPLENLRFPGCRSLPLLRDRFDDFDERLEHWDAGSETVWVVAETPGGIHEGTSRRLPQQAERIALVRGAPIVALGAVGLVEPDVAGAPSARCRPTRPCICIPDRAVLPEGSLIIGEHDLPDVVLEVDYTTDIRPGKLRVYERWASRSCGRWCPRARAGGGRPGSRSTASPPDGTAPPRPAPPRRGQHRPARMDGGGNPRGPDGARSVGADRPRARTGGPRARRPGRHPP